MKKHSSCQMQTGLWRRLFGDRWILGVEIEADHPAPRWETYGALWLWIGGQLVGNPDVEEQLGIAVSWLVQQALMTGQRPLEPFEQLSLSDRLRLFEWWNVGSTDASPVGSWKHDQLELSAYYVSYAAVCPSLDYWWVIIAEQAETEVLTWRHPSSIDAQEFRLPAGQFRRVMEELGEELGIPLGSKI